MVDRCADVGLDFTGVATLKRPLLLLQLLPLSPFLLPSHLFLPRALATHRYRSTPWACCCRGTIIVSAGAEGTQSISTWWTHQVYKDLKEAWNQSKQTVGVDIDG